MQVKPAVVVCSAPVGHVYEHFNKQGPESASAGPSLCKSYFSSRGRRWVQEEGGGLHQA